MAMTDQPLLPIADASVLVLSRTNPDSPGGVELGFLISAGSPVVFVESWDSVEPLRREAYGSHDDVVAAGWSPLSSAAA